MIVSAQSVRSQGIGAWFVSALVPSVWSGRARAWRSDRIPITGCIPGILDGILDGDLYFTGCIDENGGMISVAEISFFARAGR